MDGYQHASPIESGATPVGRLNSSADKPSAYIAYISEKSVSAASRKPRHTLRA